LRGALAAAVVALFAVATPAVGDTPTRSLLHSDTSIDLRSDGGRYLAYQNDLTRLEIYDTSTRRTREVPLGDECELHDMAAGRIIVSCTLRERGFLIRASSGKKTRLPGRIDWIALGRRWAGGYANNGTATRFADLRTLRVVRGGSMPADLDGAKPKPLPFGVQSRTHEGKLTLEWFTKTFSPPFESRLTLTRQRVRRKPQRLLAVRMHAWPGSFELGSGMVTWSRGSTAHGFDVARRKRLTWTFPGAVPNDRQKSVHVAHTEHHVFFAVPVADGYELYVTRRPG
jgi:hypothetical protein